MRNVRILISGKGDVSSYLNAVNGVGGEAVSGYPTTSDVGYDALLLCGGSDVDPKYYGEEINGSVGIDSERDKVELALVEAFVRAGKPVMGVCRGHQLLNVYFGGSLHQHIPEAELHRSGKAHVITAEQGSILQALYGDSFPVNSTHHQAVKVLGKGLRATALWEGKHVEAFEHTALPVIGVQWHPEKMCFEHRREDTVDGSKILAHFVKMCAESL